MFRNFLFVFLLIVLLSSDVRAQYSQVGDGAFSSGNFGPIATDTLPAFYSRFAFIYPSITLTNLSHGDSIRALGFQFDAFDSLRGNCNMRIFLKSSVQADYGALPINWLAESRNGMTLVYDGSPKTIIGDKPGEAVFVFNQVAGWKMDTSGMATNLEVLIEYYQSTNQVERFNWKVENNVSVTGFISANEGKYVLGASTSGMDSVTTGSTIIKPSLTIYHPLGGDDLTCKKIYALGTVPLLMDRPDSIKVRVQNVGSTATSNKKVYLNVSGANTFEDTIYVDGLEAFQSQMIYFTNYEPSNIGTENLTVQIDDDDNNANNTLVKSRLANYNVYSHADPFSPNSGGIGFNGSTGDFLAKFYVEGSSYINQIKVDFNLNGRGFQLGVWDDDGPNGNPGTEIFISDSSLSTTGTFIMPVLPRIQVSGGFYAGIRQITNTNVAFSYQTESPVRPNTFYFAAPAGDSSWVPFSPGYDFNFNIQPRLQVANDLAILEITSPNDDDSIKYSNTDSIELSAKIINYGYQNQGSFLVKYEVKNRFNQVVFSSTKIGSLSADDTATISFGKFSRYNLGKFTSTASVSLSTDSVIDNNSKSIDFYLIKDHDVAVDRIFTPSNNDSFELNREYFQPVLRVINYGVVTQNNFKIVGELVNINGEVLNYQEQFTSLTAENSVILSFDSLLMPEEGTLIYRAYTLLEIDSFPTNDTIKVILHSKKIDDMEIRSITKPKDNEKYAKGTTLTPYVNFRNDGRSNQDSAYFYATLFGENNSILYTDTVIKPASFFSTGQVVFSPFDIDSLGDFIFHTEVFIPNDQKPENDTLSLMFSVVTSNDLSLLEVLDPMPINAVSSSPSDVRLAVINRGLNDIVEAKVSLNIKNNLNQTIYSDTLQLSLGAFTVDTLSFKQINHTDIGDYYLEAVNDWVGEDEPNSNDTLSTTYIVRYQSDIELTEHLKPFPNDTLELNEDVYASLQITNLGIDTAKEIKVSIEVYDDFIDPIYSDTFLLSYLESSRSNAFLSFRKIPTFKHGTYRLESKFIGTDDNLSNNQLISNYYVALRRDAETSIVEFPSTGDKLFYKRTYRPKTQFKNNGLDDLVNVAINCRVYAEDSLIYTRTKMVDIASMSLLKVSFDSSLTYHKNADGRAEFWCDAVGDQIVDNDTLTTYFEFIQGVSVSDMELSTTEVYPNPFDGILHIEAKKPIRHLQIVDLKGTLVYQSSVYNETNIDLDLDLPKGAYILELSHSKSVERIPIVSYR